VTIQARGVVRSFEFNRGGTHTVATTTVRDRDGGFGWGAGRGRL